jgi:DNA invertase Pin-like site-specific DNA recombinase/peptidoglycan hydrolase-like protein with peptidoglycan-binding domain
MTTKLAAVSGRMTTVTVLAALVAGAFALTAAVPATATATTHAPLLAQGAGMGAKPSAAVRSVQRTLRSRGYSLGRPGVDGRFGPLTAAAVRHLQSDYGLSVDGIVGPKTHRLLRLLTRRPQRTSTARRPSSANRQPARAPSPAPPQPAPTTVPAQQGTDNTALITIIALAALAALAFGLWSLARTRPRHRPGGIPALAPIGREVYLEGHSDDPGVGDFRGYALAAAIREVPGEERVPERTSYLVDDARKAAPIWVRGSDIRRSTSGLPKGALVIGYVTVAANATPAAADAPAHMIEEACERAGWELDEVVTDRENGHGLDRPGLSYALKRIADGKARGLVVSDVRRLSRSIVDLGALMGWFRDADATLIALDLGVDTSTPAGRDIVAAVTRLGDWERERLAERKHRAVTGVGTRGRPAVSDRAELVERINAMREAKMTLQAIADQLNAEGVPTLRGGAKWRPSSVQTALGYRRPSARGPRDQLPSLEDRG